MDENKIDSLIAGISKAPFFRGQIKQVIKLPPAEPVYSASSDFSPEIRKYLSHCGIEKLYIHQAEAIESIRSGMNTVITTPTASGKTLAFNIPVAEAIKKDGVSALYVYPAKALANDQLAVLDELKKGSGIKLTAGIYDGDTDAEKKKFLRNNADLILTNPYELHQVLPFHNKWKKFYSRLGFIVLDEAHKYRGVFGSNIAFLIRRLKRVLKIYGARPQFIFSTASLANPLEFAEALAG